MCISNNLLRISQHLEWQGHPVYKDVCQTQWAHYAVENSADDQRGHGLVARHDTSGTSQLMIKRSVGAHTENLHRLSPPEKVHYHSKHCHYIRGTWAGNATTDWVTDALLLMPGNSPKLIFSCNALLHEHFSDEAYCVKKSRYGPISMLGAAVCPLARGPSGQACFNM
jgi:hypothetical protein